MVSKRLRYEILRRDNHTCRYCGRTAPDVALEIDHVVPETLGGSDHPTNLVAACRDCNSGKASTNPDDPLVEDVSQDALRWSYAMAHAAQLQRQDRNELVNYTETIRETWEVVFSGYLAHFYEPHRRWHWTKDPDHIFDWAVYDMADDANQPIYLADTEEDALRWIEDRRATKVPPLPDDWAASAHLWMAAHIDDSDLEDAAKIAKRAEHVPWRNRYRYFCGVIWNTVDERQSIARGLVETEREED